jgi:competence ComEA-like helix-hairpin-helix protein
MHRASWSAGIRAVNLRRSDNRFEKEDYRAKCSSGSEQPGRGININIASQQELESLPGIGPALARRIIEGRPYRRVEDLWRVKGIGEKRLAETREFVTVR